MKEIPCIEPLEARIAPAALISPTQVTFLDNNGETAVVKISKPLFTSVAAAQAILVFTDNLGNASAFTSTGEQNLDHINLLGPNNTALKAAQDMNISVTLIPQRDGTHTVNVGHIDAANFATSPASQNIDLGNITIQGNLGSIDAGDNFSTPAVKSLNVLSMVQNANPNSILLGPLPSFQDAGDFGAVMNVAGGVYGSIGKLNIVGSDYGIIYFGGRIGSATVGNLYGGNGGGGFIASNDATSNIVSLHVLGTVSGGTASNTGQISAATLGKIVIDGDLQGGSSINSSSAVTDSGYIQGGRIGSIKIAGNVASYANAGSGGIGNDGAIRSEGNIASLEIDGSVTGVSANPVIISAAHGVSASKHAKTDVAINSLTIKNSAAYLDVLAGYGTDISTTTGTGNTAVTNPIGAPLGAQLDGTAQLGTITIGGSLSASNIVAGVAPNSSGFFGAAGDHAIAGVDNKVGLHSSIANIIIGGTATGDGTNSGGFGFVAQQLIRIEVNGVDIGSTLAAGPGNDITPKQIGGNLYALEVA